MKTDKYDLIISGGGMVGASLACILVGYGFKVALVEAAAYSSTSQPSFDSRALALTYSSGVIFRNLNVWQGLSTTEATAIRQIDVSDAAAGGHVRLTAKDVGREALGWNVQARAIGTQLIRVLESNECVSILSPMIIQQVEIDDAGVLAIAEDSEGGSGRPLSAKLMVIADGSNSALRKQLKFTPRSIPYRQRALVCRVETDRKNRGGAYEHFTRSGPLALLPFGEKGYAVVWTLEPEDLTEVLQLSRSEFLVRLQTVFGDRAGQFNQLIGERKVYPLTLSHLKKFAKPRVVVVGNASHTVHPVAGQGFNLGLRDVAALAQVLRDARNRGWDIGNIEVLSKFARWRSQEGEYVTWFTDGLIQVFANDFPVLTPVRNLGLDLLQLLPPAKRWLLERTMGMHGRQPDLVTNERENSGKLR